jgi:polysaccharide biosynthesis protein PslH
MKILIISTQIPYPPYRGDKLKIFNIIKILSKKHKVTILTFIRDETDNLYVEELRKLNYEVYAVKHTRFNLRINLLRAIISHIPMQILCFHSTRLRKLIQQATSQNHFDVVYFNLINTLQYESDIKDSNSLKIIDLTDSMSLYIKRYLEYEKNIFKKIIYSFELRRMMRYERNLTKMDTVFICSNVDRESLTNRNIHNNIRLLLNGFDSNVYNYEETEPEKGRIIFTGNMPYYPNKDAVQYFTTEIFPKVLKDNPFVKLYIVGQNPPREIENLQSDKIIVKGFVEDIKTEYLLSEVNIAPLRVGSGTANKIIESMALGVPTVASSRSMQGFPEEIKKYVFIADTPDEFADKIKQILNDKSIRTVTMAEAREKVKDLLSLDKIGKDFLDYLEMRIKNK